MYLKIILFLLIITNSSALHFTAEPQDSPSPNPLICKTNTQAIITWKHNSLPIPTPEPIPGNYQCSAVNKFGTILSRTGNVKKFQFTEQPEDITISTHQTARFSCIIDNLFHTPKWFRNNVEVNGSSYLILPTGSLEIGKVEISHEGVYYCKTGSQFNLTSRSGRLLIANEPSSLSFTTTPKNLVVIEGEDAFFECSAVGYGKINIIWMRNGIEVQDLRYIRVGVGNLRIRNTNEDDSGIYTCRVDNSEGNIASTANLDIYKRPTMELKYKRIIGTENQNAEFECKFEGRPRPLVKWYKNGNELLNGDYFNIAGNKLSVIGLVKSDEGYYQCFASNSVGNEQSVFELVIGDLGEDLKITEISVDSESALVKWIGGEGIYKVIYNEDGKSTAATDLETEGKEIRIINLTHSTNYTISVENNGEMDKSTFRTLSAIPALIPVNITVTRTERNIKLTWDPPENGITSYRIKYRKNGRKPTTLTSETTEFNLIAEKNAEYDFKIASSNLNGTGPWTDWIKLDEDEATPLTPTLDETRVPDKPSNLYAIPMATSITINWQPPLTSIKLRGYTIGWGKGIPDVYNKLVDVNHRYFTISDLKPNSDYVISLRAYNNLGDGIPIYENVRTTDGAVDEIVHIKPSPPIGLRTNVLSANSIALYWTDTVRNDDRFYTVRITEKAKTKYVNTTESNAIIKDLKPNTEYEFSVKVLRSRKWSEWSLVTANRTLENIRLNPPNDMTLISLTSDGESTVIVTWQPPLVLTPSVLKGYLLFYTTNPNLTEWVEESINEDILTCKVSGLTPLTHYYFKMQTKYSQGYSASTSIKSVRTPGTLNVNTVKDVKLNNLILYILISLCVCLALISLVCCIYYKRNQIESPKKRIELKPPDLWIHHDQMGFKNQQQESLLKESFEFEKIPPNKIDSLRRQQQRTTGDSELQQMEEMDIKRPAQHSAYSTMTRRASSNFKSFGNDDVGLHQQPSPIHSLEGAGVGPPLHLEQMHSMSMTRRHLQTYDDSSTQEDLSQEISHLEGLMKDLTAITQQEFQC